MELAQPQPVYKVKVEEQEFIFDDEVLADIDLLNTMKMDILFEADSDNEIDLGVLPLKSKPFEIVMQALRLPVDGSFQLLSSISVPDLCEVCNTCDFLNCQKVMKIAFKVLKDIIAKSNVEKIRELFQLEDDFTEEEKAEIMREQKIYQWSQSN